MNFWEFATVSPWLTFFLVWLTYEFVETVVRRITRAVSSNRLGWPPAHCDADGDFK